MQETNDGVFKKKVNQNNNIHIYLNDAKLECVHKVKQFGYVVYTRHG